MTGMCKTTRSPRGQKQTPKRKRKNLSQTPEARRSRLRRATKKREVAEAEDQRTFETLGEAHGSDRFDRCDEDRDFAGHRVPASSQEKEEAATK